MMDFRGRHHRWKGLRLGLAGSHQVLNASLSLAAAEMLMEMGFPLKEDHLRDGLAKTKWPGRLERIGDSPPILLDGAHNPGATRVLRQALDQEFPRRRLILVLGIMGDKEIPKMMPYLVPLADLLILTRPHMERAATLELLRKHVSLWKKPTLEITDVGGALGKAMEEAGREDLVVVTGSLYTVGEARGYLIRKGLIQD